MSSSGVSRRSFFKGMAVSLVGASALGSLTACSQDGKGGVGSAASAGSGKEVSYEVVNCDLLIVGGGTAATSAAMWAAKQGKHATIIDKGDYGFSGASGFNWDLYGTALKTEGGPMQDAGASGLVNGELYDRMNEFFPYDDLFLHFINRGEMLPARNSDGSRDFYYEVEVPGQYLMQAVNGIHYRADTDTAQKSPLLTVYNRTMMTDFIVSDGRCVGVAAVYLPTGEYKVFRAPATIMCTGGTNWFYGWTGTTAKTINSADNTGEAEISALRHGCSLGHAEFGAFDFVTTYPQGLGYGWGTSVDVDGNEPGLWRDKDGELLFPDLTVEDTVGKLSRDGFTRLVASKINEGYANDKGELSVVIGDYHIRDCMHTNAPLFEAFGIDMYSEQLPIHEETFERYGTPIVDEKGMTEIPGLFCTRGAGIGNPAGGSVGWMQNAQAPVYMTQMAIDYIEDLEEVSIDWSAAEAEFSRLEDIIDNEAGNSLRPHEVLHAIQNACECWGILRTEAKLEEASAELRRIKEEDLPRMCVSAKSKTFNSEWKTAIEVHNLLYVAMLAIESAYTRKESRGRELLLEYPDIDDANWNVAILGKLTDGELELYTKNLNPKMA